MAVNSLRTRVLSSFKALHKSRKQVFCGDEAALTAGRVKINEEFRKNKDETDPQKIDEMIKEAVGASEFLKTHVVQAEFKPEKDVYEVKITDDTHLEDNVPFLGGDAMPTTKRTRGTPKCR